MSDDKVEVGGLTFDGSALDALLDDEAPAPTGEQDGNSEDVVGRGSTEPAAEDAEFQGEDDSDTTSLEADESADDGSDVEGQDSDTDERSEDVGEDSADVIPEGDFISDGDEGPMLLTGADDKGEPIYETAAELFGDHKFKIKAAGAEHEVTFDEMRSGYQRQVDYTKAKTQIADVQRAMQPYIGLLSYYEGDEGFRDTVKNYIEGVKSSENINDALLEAVESGDKAKAETLLQKRDKIQSRKKSLKAAEEAANNQRQALAAQQHEIAKSLIPSYNDSVPKVKTFLTNLGYGENEVQGFEYLDARLQNLAYLAFKQANPDSAATTEQKPGKKALQAKRKRIVRRPPKAVKAAAGRPNTPKSRSSRRAKAAFKRAYATGNSSDMVNAIATVLPDELLDD